MSLRCVLRLRKKLPFQFFLPNLLIRSNVAKNDDIRKHSLLVSCMSVDFSGTTKYRCLQNIYGVCKCKVGVLAVFVQILFILITFLY